MIVTGGWKALRGVRGVVGHFVYQTGVTDRRRNIDWPLYGSVEVDRQTDRGR